MSTTGETRTDVVGARATGIGVGLIVFMLTWSIGARITERILDAPAHAYLAMGVLQEVSGRGVGGALLSEGIRWAEGAGINRLELNVMAHNERAVRLYERMGFVREGIRRRALLVGGTWVDEYFMARLSPLPSRPE